MSDGIHILFHFTILNSLLCSQSLPQNPILNQMNPDQTLPCINLNVEE